MTTFVLREGVEASLREGTTPPAPLAIIDLKGDLHTFTERSLREAYQQATEAGAKHIALNFAGVNYINSSGVSVVIEFLAEAREHGRHVYFTALSPHYAKIFRIMGLTQYGTLAETNEEARAAASA